MSVLDRFVFELSFGSFFGALTWYDVSSFLNLGSSPLTVTRGRQQERTAPTPGQLSCDLLNDDGRFTPGRASSPYWPYVLDGAPCRLSVLLDSTVNMLDNSSVEGGVAEWSAGGSPAPTVGPSTTHVYTDSGGWSMLVTWGTGGTLPNAGRRVYGLIPGRTYTFSAYVWVPTGDVHVNLALFSPFTVGGASAVHDAFTRISVTWVATSTSHDVVVGPATSATAGDVVWVDAMQLEEGASATTLAAGSVRQPLFYGPSLEFPFSWQGPAGLAAQTRYVAVDMLRRLPRRDQLRPMVVEEALLDSPLVLLPLDEPDGAVQAGNLGSSQATGTLLHFGAGGTYTFGVGTGPPADGASSLVLTPAVSASQGWAVSCLAGFTGTAVTVEAWINVAAGLGTGSVVDLRVDAGGAGTLIASLRTLIGLLGWTSDNGALTLLGPSIDDGATHHVAAVYVCDGVNHTIILYLDGTQAATTSIASAATTFSAPYITVGGHKNALFTGTINHASVYGTALSAARIAAHYHAGKDGFGGERSDARISRLASYANLASLTPAATLNLWQLDSAAYSILDTTTILAGSDLNLEVGSAQVWGQSGGGGDILAEMNAVADTEGGIVLADRAGRLQFQGRAHRYNRPSGMVADSGDVNPDLTPTYDDALIVNDLTVTTQDGAGVRVLDSASVTQRGAYQQQTQLLTRDPLDAYSIASWIVARQARPSVRYPTLTFDLATLPVAQVNALLALDVGDRLDVAGLPSQAPNAAEGMFIEGYQLTVSHAQLQLTFNTSPAAGWQVWQLNSSTQSILDSTSVLAY